MNFLKRLFTISLFLVNFNLFYLSCGIQSSLALEDVHEIGMEGLRDYQEGRYKKAASVLLTALEKGDLTFALPYADICRRHLDEEYHPLKEAAYWYTQAAEAHDGDALSYLGSLNPVLLEDSPLVDKIDILKRIWLVEERAPNADKGFSLYRSASTSDDFREAARFLKRASKGNHPLAQQFYADICRRQLDDRPHSWLEASMWSLLSAIGGDAQSASYLHSIVPHIWSLPDPQSQMQVIVNTWISNHTKGNLIPLKPGKINDYLVIKYNRRIDKTTSQKIPYFFDKIVTALMWNLESYSASAVEDTVMPVFEEEASKKEEGAMATSHGEEVRSLELQRTCRQEDLSSSLFTSVDHTVVPFGFGPVYFHYFSQLDRVFKDGLLKKPSTAVKISSVYRYILDAVNEALNEFRATDLTALSHREYPWLLAGIKFWKEKHKKPFNKTSLKEEYLLRTLSDMDALISKEDINRILKEIESESVWPNDKDHPVSREFNDNVRKFFVSLVSRESDLVKNVKGLLFRRLSRLELDCEQEEDTETLTTSFLISRCETLVLRNISSKSSKCRHALMEGQRYFVMMKSLTVSFSEDFNRESKNGKMIEEIFHKIRKRGISMT